MDTIRSPFQMEPISIAALVISMIASITIALAIGLTYGGKACVAIYDGIRELRFNYVVINQNSCLVAYIAVCHMFKDLKSQIKLPGRHWEFVTFTDSNRENRTFCLPKIGEVVTLKFKRLTKTYEIHIEREQVIGAGSQFKIFFSEVDHFRLFGENVLTKFLSEKEVSDLIETMTPRKRQRNMNLLHQK